MRARGREAVEPLREYRERVHKLSPSQARFLETEARQLGPRTWEELARKSQTLLVEVACSPTSILSATVQSLAGYSEAAIRCAQWNGCDLETRGGVRQVLNLIRTHQPQHVWISPECGPFSPLQAINQRSPEQKAELDRKRKQAIKQYLGAGTIFHFCMQHGIHCSWEWAQKCQAWRLPFMQRIVKRYVPYMSVTQGCQVNLRDPKSGQLMHKGWKIMTSHAHLSELMHRPCSCGPNYRHAKCEGGLAGHSAFYTPEFAKRVCHALFHEFSHALLSQEMDGRSCLLSPFGKGPECVCRDLCSADTEHLCSTCLDRETHGTGNPPEAEEPPQGGTNGRRDQAQAIPTSRVHGTFT